MSTVRLVSAAWVETAARVYFGCVRPKPNASRDPINKSRGNGSRMQGVIKLEIPCKVKCIVQRIIRR
jgi:hypothetical protein